MRKSNNIMLLDDFRYMWCGQEVKALQLSDANILRYVNLQRKTSGKALLLLHGFSSSPAVYREIIDHLTNYDAIYCPVLPGHAESISAFSKVKSCEWLNCSYDAYAYLANNYEKIDVMGLSLGGLLALNVSYKFKVNHLYLLAPALKLDGWITSWLWAAVFLKFLGFHKIRNRGGNLLSKKFQEITYRSLPLHAIIELLNLIKKFSFKSPTCPSDLFLGRHDEVVDSDAVANLFINSQTTKIHWLENSAHVLSLDGDYQEIIRVVQSNI